MDAPRLELKIEDVYLIVGELEITRRRLLQELAAKEQDRERLLDERAKPVAAPEPAPIPFGPKFGPTGS